MSNLNNIQIAIAYNDEASRLSAVELAQALGLELLDLDILNLEKQGPELNAGFSSLNLNHSSIKQFDFLLLFKNMSLFLKEIATGTEINVDFNSINKSRLNKKLQLAKAVGFKAGVPSVIDATAGMGRDAYSLATLGCQVTLIEKSKIIAALLRDGLSRQEAVEEKLIARMSLQEGNAVELIPSLEAHDVIYLDPMFADRAKQALPKKEMQFFRKLLGHDDEVDSLLEVALQHAKKRVVVKRHRTAKPLLDKKPNIELVGKQMRFDIYLV